MQQENLNTAKSHWEKILHISLFVYLLLLIFPHVTTLREIAFWTAFLSWVLSRLRKSEPFIALNPIIVSLSLFMVIAIISSLTGMEPFENLKRFKGELIVPFILFLITATEFNSIEKIKRLLFAPIIAFAVYILLAIVESTNYGLQYFWDKTHREQYLWLTNYSHMAAITLPLILGVFLFVKNRWLKYFLITFAILEFAILAAYRSIAPFLGVVSVLLLWIIFVRPRKYRLWMITFISLFIFIFTVLIYTQKDNPAIAEYRAKFDKIINVSGEVKSESGFSGRISLWRAAADIIKDRPLLGYGWGMKKFPKLVQQEKFLEKWRVDKPFIYNVYTTYKGVNLSPHNLFVEIAIQSGLLGLAAFIIFIGIYLYSLIKGTLRRSSETDNNFSVILIGGTFLSFFIMNLMNNELGNVSGKILFVVLGAGAAWINRTVRNI